MEKLPHKKANYPQQLDSPFEMWFRYQPKVSANLGFGIGLKSK
jgi:hypothetical protein